MYCLVGCLGLCKRGGIRTKQCDCEVGFYLDRDFFSHGSYYVGQSRVGNEEKLKILSKDGKTTQNVVYPEVLG